MSGRIDVKETAFIEKRRKKIKVCYGCVLESYLSSYIKKRSTSKGCDFCNSNKKSISFNEFFKCVLETICFFYTQADQSYLQESKWLSFTSDTEDILRVKIEITDNEKLFQYLLKELPEIRWISRNDYAGEIAYSWEKFCAIVKHNMRYVFFNVPEAISGQEFEGYIPYNKMLDSLSYIVDKCRLISKFKSGEIIFRGRLQEAHEVFRTVKDMGVPPKEIAEHNRMSPAGIPMFYAGDSINTVTAELCRREDNKKKICIGEFQFLKDVCILDLTKKICIPSFFDVKRRKDRYLFEFIKEFQKEISKPPDKTKNDNLKLEYIPLQIITEYFRFLCFSGKLQGIKYPSSLCDGACIALFISNDEIICCNNDEVSTRKTADKVLPFLKTSLHACNE